MVWGKLTFLESRYIEFWWQYFALEIKTTVLLLHLDLEFSELLPAGGNVWIANDVHLLVEKLIDRPNDWLIGRLDDWDFDC